MARVPVNEPYKITTTFGEPDSNAKFGRHSGIDYAVPLDRPILAPVSGSVAFAGWSPTGGNMVQIYDGKYWHRLMHNNSLKVSQYDQVTEGQVVALAGTTGLSTGVHCHYDVATQANPSSFAAFVDPSSIIGKSEDIMTPEDVKTLFRAVEHKEASPEDVRAWTGQSAAKYASEALRGNRWLTQNHQITYYDQNQRLIEQLQKRVQELQGSGSISRADLQKVYDDLGKLISKGEVV